MTDRNDQDFLDRAALAVAAGIYCEPEALPWDFIHAKMAGAAYDAAAALLAEKRRREGAEAKPAAPTVTGAILKPVLFTQDMLLWLRDTLDQHDPDEADALGRSLLKALEVAQW